jgi:hypothetical protein
LYQQELYTAKRRQKKQKFEEKEMKRMKNSNKEAVNNV